MARKERYSKEDLINGGIKFVRKNGVEQLNVRSLATFIGCSTQPLFRNYKNIEEYRLDLKNAMHEKYKQFIHDNTDKNNYFTSVCYAYALYAKIEPNIFKALFITSLAGSRTIEEVINSPWNKETIGDAVKRYNISEEKAEKIYRDIRFYTHGIASQLSCESIIIDEKELYSLIEEMINKLL